MRRGVHRQEQAKADLADIVDYFAAIRLDLALRFLNEVDATLRGLLEFPGKGRPCGYSNPRAADLRVYAVDGFDNYLLYYRILPEGIELVRVLHGARDRDVIFGQ